MTQKKIRFTKVTALRHGESAGNLIPVYQGKEPGSDLTDKGKKQAKAAADYLNAGEVSVIYCSPLARTRQTLPVDRRAGNAVPGVAAEPVWLRTAAAGAP